MTIKPFDPQRSVASLTIAELEAFVKQTIQQTRQSSISTQANLNTPFDPDAKPFWEVVVGHTSEVPDEVWANIPEDASEQVDRYLHHS